MSLKKLYVNICSPAASNLDYGISDNESNSGDTSEEDDKHSEDPLMLKPLPARTRFPVMPVLAPIIRNRSGRPHNTKSLRFCPQPQSAVAASFRLERQKAKLNKKDTKDGKSGNEHAKIINNLNITKEAIDTVPLPSPCDSWSSDIKCNIETFHVQRVECSAVSADNIFDINVNLNTDIESENDTFSTAVDTNIASGNYEFTVVEDEQTETEFVCNRPKCTFAAKNRQQINLHKRRVHRNSKDYVCDQCPYRAHAASDLRKHYRTHSGEQPYVCPHDGCDYKGRHSNNLDYHKRKMHPTGEPLKCEYEGCCYTTRFPPTLRIHIIKKHSGEKTIACDLCPYRCYLRGELRKHMLSHSAATPYGCDFPGCGYACKLSSNLRKHRRCHTEERPYACEQCAFRSNFISSLKAHRRTHTDERPYCCDQCGYRCNSASNLKKHISQRHLGSAYTPKPKLYPAGGAADRRSESPLGSACVPLQPSHVPFRKPCQTQS